MSVCARNPLHNRAGIIRRLQGHNVVLRELGVVLRVWLLDARAASLPVDLETMEAFGSRGEESNHAIWGPGQDPGQKPKR